jgi:hypothetical protein
MRPTNRELGLTVCSRFAKYRFQARSGRRNRDTRLSPLVIANATRASACVKPKPERRILSTLGSVANHTLNPFTTMIFGKTVARLSSMNHPHLGDIESWLFASGRSVPGLSTFATTKHLRSIAAASIEAIP